MSTAKFQLHLTDVLMIACVPAAGAIALNKLGMLRTDPAITYGLAIIAALPGMLVGLLVTQRHPIQGLERAVWMALSLGISLVLSTVVLFLGEQSDLQPRYRAENQSAAAVACKAFAEAEEIDCRRDYDGEGCMEYAPCANSLLERVTGSGDLALIDKTCAGADAPAKSATTSARYVPKAQEPNDNVESDVPASPQ
jgi:hypothetical protein